MSFFNVCCNQKKQSEPTKVVTTKPQTQNYKASELISQPFDNIKINNNPTILQKAKKFNQGHLVQHYQSLKDPQLKTNFLEQLKAIDFSQSTQLFEQVYLASKIKKEEQKVNFTPIEQVCSIQDQKKNSQQLEKIGYERIVAGQVGVCIMSGGQGTRLGFDHPKGMFDLGLHCKLTLFGYFAHRLLSLMKLAVKKVGNSKVNQKKLIKWYLMTSQMNHIEIQTYFKQNKYFGYDPQSIVFFPQGGLPALSYDGKIMIQSEGNISLAPGGNGVIYSQMKNKGVLQHMKKNNVKYIYFGPVDNVLLKLGDPISLGYMVKNNLQIVSHYLKKRSPDQKVGIHVQANGLVKIIQYSETPTSVKQLRNQKGQLVYGHGGKGTMYITRQFIQKLTNNEAMIAKVNKKYHLAQKKIKYYDPLSKTAVKPENNNGVKFQLFYFDIFQEAKRFGLFETLREEEFSPLKNATGDDSPDSARKMLKALNKKWVIEAGITLQGQGQVQIDPIISYQGQGLGQYVKQKFGSTSVKLPLYIE